MAELGFETRQFGSRPCTLNPYTTIEKDWSHSVCGGMSHYGFCRQEPVAFTRRERDMCVIRVLRTQGGSCLAGDIRNCLQSRSFEEGEGIENIATLECLCELQLSQGEHFWTWWKDSP